MNTKSIQTGEAAAKKSILNLLLVAALKFLTGLFTGMTVMITDAISTLAQTLGIFAAYIGLKISRKSANKNFEYGFYKAETIAALLISIGIIYLGYVMCLRSIEIIKAPSAGQHQVFAITATLLAIHQSHRLANRLKMAGEKSNSLALMTSAKDKRIDMFTGFAVLISIIANYKGIPYVEGAVSTFLAIIILKVGFGSAKESLFFLLDYWNDPKLTKQIKQIFHKEKDLIIGIRKIRLRRAGTFIFGEAFVDINPFASIKDLRSELDLLQRKIHSLNPYIKDFAIYSQVSGSKKTKIAIPMKKGTTIRGEIASTLKSTKGYLFIEMAEKKVKKVYYKALKASEKKPIQLSDFLQAEKVNILIDNELSSLIYFNLRRTHQILIYPNFSDIKRADKTLELILIDE